MAKEFEDKFYNELQNSVISDGKEQVALENMSIDEKVRMLAEMSLDEIKLAIAGLSLAEQRAIYEGCISVVDSNVIKDPKTLEKLKKELHNINKEIEKKNQQKLVEQGQITVQETDEKEETEEGKAKEEKQVKESNKQEKEFEDNTKQQNLKQVYYDAIVAYYDCRMKTLRHQREKGDLLASDVDYRKEEKLELEMYKARKAYMALGNEDPYEKFRANHDFIDRQAHEPFEVAIREKTRKYREIEREIEQIDKAISETNEELDTKELSQRDRNERTERISELEAKKTKLSLEKAEHKDAEVIIQKQRERTSNNRQLQQLRRDAASKEQLKGYDYRRSQKQISQHNLDVAQKTEYQNIQKRIEEREDRIKELTKKLEKTPDVDLEERLNILESLNKETNMLQADEDQQHNLDKAYVMTESEMKQQTNKTAQIAEETERQFEKDTREVREAIEQKDKVAGELAVEQASIVSGEEKERDIKLKAAMAAAVIESPKPGKDTLAEDVGQYMVAKCVIEGVEKQVRNPEDPEDARAMVEHEEQLLQADKELDEVQQSIEKQIQ